MVGFLAILTIILFIYLSTKYFKLFCASKLKINIYFDDNKTLNKKKLN